MSDHNDRSNTIKGEMLKFKDGIWQTKAGEPFESKALLCSGVLRCLQRWENKKAQHIFPDVNNRLPDAEDVNERIPQENWPVGPDGEPEPPWKLTWFVYLINTLSYERYTFVSTSKGGARACSDLIDATDVAREVNDNPKMRPIVELSSVKWKTQFGNRDRPHFRIIKWTGGAAAPVAPQVEAPPPAAQIEPPKKPVPAGGDFDDEIPSDDNKKPAGRCIPGRPGATIEHAEYAQPSANYK